MSFGLYGLDPALEALLVLQDALLVLEDLLVLRTKLCEALLIYAMVVTRLGGQVLFCLPDGHARILALPLRIESRFQLQVLAVDHVNFCRGKDALWDVSGRGLALPERSAEGRLFAGRLDLLQGSRLSRAHLAHLHKSSRFTRIGELDLKAQELGPAAEQARLLDGIVVFAALGLATVALTP